MRYSCTIQPDEHQKNEAFWNMKNKVKVTLDSLNNPYENLKIEDVEKAIIDQAMTELNLVSYLFLVYGFTSLS